MSKKPRFIWTVDIHNQFISAIFDVGLAHAIPTTVTAQMNAKKSIHSVETIRSHMRDMREMRDARYETNPERIKFKVRSNKFIAPTYCVPPIRAVATVDSSLSSDLIKCSPPHIPRELGTELNKKHSLEFVRNSSAIREHFSLSSQALSL